MQRWTILSLVVAAAVLLPAALPAQDLDVINPVSGAPARGTVKRVSPTIVTIDTANGERDIEVNNIRRVSFATDPPELKRARDAVAAGQFEDAKADLSKVNLAAVSQDIVKADVAYYLAYANAKLALAGNGDKEAAHTALLDCAKKQDHHFYEAAELLGDLAMARGKFSEAQSYYAALANATWPDYKLKASILQAKSLVAQRKYAEAQAMYDTVINSPLNTPEANREKQFAELGRAVCMAETGNAPQAAQSVNKIIQNNDPKDSALFGRAYNALGACYEKQGDPKQALIAYLHTDLMFYGEPEVHAEALYHLSKLWAEAYKNSDRALQARNLLKNRYSGTSWARLD